jgi:mRNA (guanine-N7-)-methyltransferase
MSVQKFYNNKKEYTKNFKEARDKSPIVNVRIFNNWIKASLLLDYAEKAKVVEFACGKGGDLTKYSHQRISSYSGFDISEESLAQAYERYNKQRLPFEVNLYHADFTKPIPDKIARTVSGSFVSCQFALHYAFGSKSDATTALANISACLSSGYVVITCPSDIVLSKILLDTDALKYDSKYIKLSMDKADKDRYRAGEKFGIKYNFHLEGAIINVDEYFIDSGALIEVAGAAGLKLVEKTPFMDYYERFYAKSELRDHYRFTLDRDDIDAINFYTIYVFSKAGPSEVIQYYVHPKYVKNTKIHETGTI